MPASRLDLVVTATPDEVWEIIGSFGSIAAWHPLVATAELSGNGTIRKLMLASGRELVEKELSRDELTYRYALQSGSLPVEFFSGELTVSAEGDGARIVWEADYAAHEVADDVAQAAVDRFILAPEAALRARFG